MIAKRLKPIVYKIILDKIPKDFKDVRKNLEYFIKVAEEDNKIKYKRIKIEFGKKSSDYIITEDITNVPGSEYDEDMNMMNIINF